MRNHIRSAVTYLISTSLILSAFATTANGASREAPSNFAVTYTAPSANGVSFGANLTWRSPNAADTVILGYRISGRQLSFINPPRAGGITRWNSGDTWTDIYDSRNAITVPPGRYTLYSGSEASIPVDNGYPLPDGENFEWRVGAVSEEPISQRKPGISNICVLRTSGTVECSGLFNAQTAGGVNVFEGQYLKELGTTFSRDYRPVDGISPNGRVGLVDKLEMGYQMACVISRAGKLWCWGDQTSSKNTKIYRVHPTEGNTLTPKMIELGENVIDVAIARDTTCALVLSGKIKCWGSNEFGLLGNNSAVGIRNYVRAPVNVSDQENWIFSEITATDGTICGVATSKGGQPVNRQLVCWGETRPMPFVNKPNVPWVTKPYAFTDNSITGNLPAASSPSGYLGILSLSLSSIHGCAVKENVGLQCWSLLKTPGSFTSRLGNGPSLVDGTIRSATEISSDSNGSCWIKPGITNQIQCIGENYVGINSENQSAPTPVTVDLSQFQNANSVNPQHISLFAGMRCFAAAPLGGRSNIGGCWGSNVTKLIVDPNAVNEPNSQPVRIPAQDPALRAPNFAVLQNVVTPPADWIGSVSLRNIVEGQVIADFVMPSARYFDPLTAVGYQYSIDGGQTWSVRQEISRDNFILQARANAFSIAITQGLPAGEALKFKFYLKNRGGFGTASPPTNTLFLYRTPGLVQNISFTPTEKYAGVLTWNPPAISGLTQQAITQYRNFTPTYIIQVTDVLTGARKTSITTTELRTSTNPNPRQAATLSNGLVQGRSYVANIKVFGATPAQDSQDASFIFTMTAAPDAPRNITAQRVDANSVNLLWQAPPDTGLTLTYTLRVKYFPAGGGSQLVTTIPNIVGTNYVFQTPVSGIPYDVDVQAVNSLGASPFSATYRFTNTTQLQRDTNLPQFVLPTAPRNLAVDGEVGTSTSFTWQAPESDGGIALDGGLFLGYQFSYSIDNGATKIPFATNQVAQFQDNTYGTLWDIPFSPLNKVIIYLAAKNVVGVGPTTSLEITQLFRPSAPVNVNIGLAQYYVEDKWDNFYRLEWEEPASTGGTPITRYIITDKTCLNSCFEPIYLAADARSFEFPISQFSYGVASTIHIQAENAKGVGYVNVVTFMPAVAKPSTPVIRLDTASGDSSSIVIRFLRPTSPGAEIDEYLVSYSPANPVNENDALQKEREFYALGAPQNLFWLPISHEVIDFDNGDVGIVLSNLTLNNYYYFRVQASNMFGVSDLHPFSSYLYAQVTKSAAEIEADLARIAQEEADRLARELEAARVAAEIAAEQERIKRLEDEAAALAQRLAEQLAEQERLDALERQRLLDEQIRIAEEALLQAAAARELAERERLLAEQLAAEEAARLAAEEAARLAALAAAQEEERLRLLAEANAIAPDNKEANLGDGAGPFQEVPVVNAEEQEKVIDPIVNPPAPEQNPLQNPFVEPVDNQQGNQQENPAPVANDNIPQDAPNDAVFPAIPDDRVNADNPPIAAVNVNPLVDVPAAVGGGGGAIPAPQLPPVQLPQFPVFVPIAVREQVVAAVVAQEVFKLKEVVAEQKQDVALKVAEEVVVKINDQVKVLNDALNKAEKVGFAVPEKITTVAVVQIPKVTPAVVTPSVVTEMKTAVITQLTKAEEKLVNALPKGNDVVIKTKALIKKFTKLFPKGVKIAFATLSSSLTKSSITQLKKLATIPFKKITVTGYVQKSKNKKNDKSLSKSRADAVAKVLIKAGIKKKLITTIAGGVGGKSKKSRSAVIIIA